MALISWSNVPAAIVNSKFSGVYQATVMDVKDPQRMGRLRVWMPESSGDIDDPQSWITVSYCSPFAGATSIRDVRKPEDIPENNQTSYGFWAVPPDVGNQVLVMFANNDPSRGFWIGCINQQKTNRMVPGVPSGVNFSDDNNELPVTEHNRRTDSEIREGMQRAELDDGMSRGLKTQGLIRDHFRGITHSGSRRETPSEVYGLLTPGPLRAHTQSREPTKDEPRTRMGGHQFVMDDAIGQEKIRLRTRNGAQILLDESNGIMYISNRDGTAWIHMDEAGRIDIYGAETMSVRAERDFVLRADRDIIMEAGRNISLKANRDWSPSESGSQHAGETAGEGGRITLHANEDMDIITTDDLRITVNQDGYLGVGRNFNTVVGDTQSTQVHQQKSTVVNVGDWRATVNSNILATAGSNAELFAGNNIKISSMSNTEAYAFGGKMDLGAQADVAVKSTSGNISVVAEDDGGNFSVRSNSGRNQLEFKEGAAELFSTGGVTQRSKKTVNSQVYSGFDVNSNGEITKDGAPLDNNCLRIDDGVNVSFTEDEILMDTVKDIKMKSQDLVDRFGKPVSNSLETINDGLDEIQENLNSLSNTVGEYLSELWGVLDGLDIPDLPIGFTLPFPVLPSFPQLPSFGLPALNLPSFDFDFCFDIGPLLNIDAFPKLPNDLFGNFSIDLNGWSKRSIKNWAQRQAGNFTKLVDSLRVDRQIAASFDQGVSNLKNSMRSLRRSLNNLTSVGITVSDKGAYIADYTTSIESLIENLKVHRSDVQSVSDIADQPLSEIFDNPIAVAEGVVGELDESVVSAFAVPDSATYTELLDNIITETESHLDAMQRVVQRSQQNPALLDNTDFSDLQQVSNLFDQLSGELDTVITSASPDEPEPPAPPAPDVPQVSGTHLSGFCTTEVGSSCNSVGLLTAVVTNTVSLTPPYRFSWIRRSGVQLNGTDIIDAPSTNNVFASVPTSLTAEAESLGTNTVASRYDVRVEDSSTPPVILETQLASVNYEVYGRVKQGSLVGAQTETDYDDSDGNGTFTGGSGYSTSDEITLSNGDIITVDAVDGAGSVTEFTVSTVNGSATTGDTLTQASVSPTGGTGFELVPDYNNIT